MERPSTLCPAQSVCIALARPPETWKLIARHPTYLVSSRGKVWSHQHQDFLTPHMRGKGYEAVWLSGSGRREQRYVHELVCGAFHGPRPEGRVVDHENDRRRDNRAANLTWVTYAENARRMVRAGRSPRAKLTPEHVRLLRGRASDVDAARWAGRWGVTTRTIRRILKGTTWVGV